MYQVQTLAVPSPLEKALVYPHVDELAALVKKHVGEGHDAVESFQILTRIYQVMGLSRYRMICEKAQLDTRAQLVAELVLNPTFSNLKIQIILGEMLNESILRHRPSAGLKESAERLDIDLRRFNLIDDVDACVLFTNHFVEHFAELSPNELINLFNTIKKVLGTEQFNALCAHELLGPEAKFLTSLSQQLHRPEDQKTVFEAFYKAFTSLRSKTLSPAQKWAYFFNQIIALEGRAGDYLPMVLFSMAAKNLDRSFYQEIVANIEPSNLVAKFISHLALTGKTFSSYHASTPIIKLFKNVVKGNLAHPENLASFITYASILYARDKDKLDALKATLDAMFGEAYKSAETEALAQPLNKFLTAIRSTSEFMPSDISAIFSALKWNLRALQENENAGLVAFIQDCQKYFKGALPYMNIINACLKEALGEERFNSIQAVVTPYDPDAVIGIDVSKAFPKMASTTTAPARAASAEDPIALDLKEIDDIIARFYPEHGLIGSTSLALPASGLDLSVDDRSSKPRTSSTITDPKSVLSSADAGRTESFASTATTVIPSADKFGKRAAASLRYGSRMTSPASTKAAVVAVTKPVASIKTAAAPLPTISASAFTRYGHTTATVRRFVPAPAVTVSAAASEKVDSFTPTLNKFTKLIINAIPAEQRHAISQALKLLGTVEASMSDTKKWACCFNNLLSNYPENISAHTLKQVFVLFGIAAGKELYAETYKKLFNVAAKAATLEANTILANYYKGAESFEYYGYGDITRDSELFTNLTASFAGITTDLDSGIEKLKEHLVAIQNNLVLSASQKTALAERVIENACEHLQGPEHITSLTAVFRMLNSDFPGLIKRDGLYKNYKNAINYALQCHTFNETHKAIDAAIAYINICKGEMLTCTDYAFSVLRSIGLNNNLSTAQKNQLAQGFIEELTKTMSPRELEEFYVSRPISLHQRLVANKADAALAYLHGASCFQETGFSRLTKMVKNAFIAVEVSLTQAVKNFLNTHRDSFSLKALFGMNTKSANIIAERERQQARAQAKANGARPFQNFGACGSSSAAASAIHTPN